MCLRVVLIIIREEQEIHSQKKKNMTELGIELRIIEEKEKKMDNGYGTVCASGRAVNWPPSSGSLWDTHTRHPMCREVVAILRAGLPLSTTKYN
jgi:hypothetical protein